MPEQYDTTLAYMWRREDSRRREKLASGGGVGAAAVCVQRCTHMSVLESAMVLIQTCAGLISRSDLDLMVDF